MGLTVTAGCTKPSPATPAGGSPPTGGTPPAAAAPDPQEKPSEPLPADLPAIAECQPQAVNAEKLPTVPAPVLPVGIRYAIDSAASCTAYTVREKFANKDLPTPAVGMTSTFAGEIVLDEDGHLRPSAVLIAMETLKSDAARRDDVVKNMLTGLGKEPVAEFHITGAQDGKTIPRDGTATELKLEGTLKLNGVEKPLVFTTKVKVEGNTLTLTATTAFRMTDFGLQPPDILNTLKVEDPVQVYVKVAATTK
jgi:polyisoprenoid-binding protein YceI